MSNEEEQEIIDEEKRLKEEEREERRIKDKTRYQTRIELEASIPKPEKKEKVRLTRETQSYKNQEYFNRLADT